MQPYSSSYIQQKYKALASLIFAMRNGIYENGGMWHLRSSRRLTPPDTHSPRQSNPPLTLKRRILVVEATPIDEHKERMKNEKIQMHSKVYHRVDLDSVYEFNQ